MDIELLEIGAKIRKAVIFTIRGCLRSAYNHPFLVGFVCFLSLLYKLSPFIFSLLVSASPILFCTAVLLGVLLSYGEPNIPEIEIEEKTTLESASLKTGLLGDSIVVDQNETYFDHSDDTAPLIKERLLEIESNGGEIWEGNGDLGVLGHEPDEKLKAEAVDSDDEKSETDSFDSETVNVDSLDSPPRSPWTRIEEREAEEERAAEENEFSDSGSDQADKEDRFSDSGSDRAGEEDGFSDSGSDRAESSSPDASMAEIMPMLDELHPLLDNEPPQPVRTSHSGSDVASDKSLKSDDESENQEEDNEEDDAQEEKEETKKSAIMWTEEDQKNLMDLGSSEVERNQRLENLILRRRSRKNMSIVPERNLIDLDSTDYPFSGLAPISTRRKNPFDSPRDDHYNNLGLPPIPGSAPSVLLPRRNPFDIPYDSSEEKPDLMGDGFKEEFATVQSREAIFRRHESFNVGPSNFGPNRKDVRMRPFFVPESSISEESSYSSFQRQSSELSESKVSSVPETESIGSVEALEGLLGDPHSISHEEEEQEDVIREPQMISEIENVPELVGHGSQSSEDEYSVEVQIDDLADRDQLESVIEVEAGGEHVYRSYSSSSSLSEVSERVCTEMESEGPILEERQDIVNVLRQTSMESSDLSVSGALVVDVSHRAPVYDLSPREIGTSIPSNIEILPALSVTHPVDEPRPVDVFYISEHENVKVDFSEVGKEVSNMGQLEVSEPLFEGQLRDERAIGVEERETVESQDSDEKLISKPSVEGNAYPLHDACEIHEPNFQHLGEVQASIALGELSEDAQITQNLNISEAEELDHDISSYIISPLNPEFLSDPSIETTGSLFNAQTTIEVDNITEIDEDLLSELDNVGDFSVHQWGSVEENKIEDVIDIHEEGMEYNMSELQTSETSEAQHIDVSRMEFDERDGPDTKTSENETHSEVESKARTVGHVVESEARTESKVQSINNDFVSKKAESTLQETEVSKIEDIDLAFQETLAEHSENSSVAGPTHKTSVLEVSPKEEDDATLDPKQTHLVDCAMIESEESQKIFSELGVAEKNVPSEETILSSEDDEARTVRSVMSRDYGDNVSEIPELRVHSKDDFDLISRTELNERGDMDGKTSENETLSTMENEARSVGSVISIPEIPELEVQLKDVDVSRTEFNERDGPDSKTSENETVFEVEKNEAQPVASVVTISEIPESEVQSIEYVDFLSKKDESPQVQVDTDTSISLRHDLEGSKIEDIELAFREITTKETTVDFEPVVKETPVENSRVAGSTHETLVLEVGPIEKDDATLYSKQPIPDSLDRDLHVIESEETQETFSESGVAEKNVPSEGTILSSEEDEARIVRSVMSRDYGDNISELPELGARSNDGFDLVLRTEFNERDSLDGKTFENKTLYVVENEAQPIGSAVNIPEIPELEVQSKEDVDVISRTESNTRDGLDSETSENETLFEVENKAQLVGSAVNTSEIPESGVHSNVHVDFVSKKDESPHGQVDTDTTISLMHELEVRRIEDIELAFKEITTKETIVDFEPVVKETLVENSSVAGSTHETLALEVGLIEKDDTTLYAKQPLSDSFDHNLHVIESETDVAEKNIPSEETILPPNDRALDAKTLKQPKLNSDDDESVEVKADEVGSSVVKSRVAEVDVAAEKPVHEVEAEAAKGSHPTVSLKGKGKVPKNSSSSSSSDSSSSDSERD